MTSKTAVAMFVYGDASHDSRVRREADALAATGRRVLVVGHTADGLPDHDQVGGWTLLRVGEPDALRPGREAAGSATAARARWVIRYVRAMREWAGAAAAAAGHWASDGDRVVWHGHDLTGLLAAARAQRTRPGILVYDSHELFMEAGTATRLPRPARSLIRALERRLARRADLVITVNESIAGELASRYGLTRPAVVMNCPPVDPVPPSRVDSPLRTVLGLEGRAILLHHGGLTGGRGILATVDALEHLPARVSLVVLGDGDLVPAIRERSAGLPAGRLVHHPSVPVDELPAWVAGADVGVIAFEPVETNNVLATPNKLFECLAGGVPVVVSDFPEMARVVRDAGVGATCDPTSPRSIADACQRVLDGDRDAWHEACRSAARTRYSWQRQSAVLVEAYDRVEAARS